MCTQLRPENRRFAVPGDQPAPPCRDQRSKRTGPDRSPADLTSAAPANAASNQRNHGSRVVSTGVWQHNQVQTGSLQPGASSAACDPADFRCERSGTMIAASGLQDRTCQFALGSRPRPNGGLNRPPPSGGSTSFVDEPSDGGYCPNNRRRQAPLSRWNDDQNIEHVEQQPDGDRDQKELHEKGPAKSGRGN